MVVLGVPLGNLMYQAGSEVALGPSGPVRTWSIAKALAMMARSPMEFGEELARSALVAQLVAAGALAVASPLAWWARSGGWRLTGSVAMMAACLAVPSPLLAVWLIRIMNAPGQPLLNYLFDRSLVPICAVQLVKTVPLAFFVLWPAMRGIAQPLVDLARLDGWSAPSRFLHLGVRLTLPPHAAAWIVVAAMSVAELTATILVSPPGFSTVAVTVFQLIHYGVEDRLAGLCLTLWGVSILLALAAGLLVASWARRRRRIIGRPAEG